MQMGGRDSEMLQIACKGKFFWGEGQGGGTIPLGGVVPLPNRMWFLVFLGPGEANGPGGEANGPGPETEPYPDIQLEQGSSGAHGGIPTYDRKFTLFFMIGKPIVKSGMPISRNTHLEFSG